MKKLILIDGNSLLYRAYHATAYSGALMKSSKGVTTNALYAFTVMMMNIVKEYEFSHILVAFDAGKKTFRHETFGEYKGGRKATPPELKEQFPLAKELLDRLHVKRFELENYEADDILGTLSKEAEEKGFDAIDIISGDRDILQLISDTTTVQLTKKGLSELEAYTPEVLEEKLGIKPIQVTDLKGLMGDASDNIPGIPGVGEKTALKLLNQYETVENLLAHSEELTGKLKEKVQENQELAKMSKAIATIDRTIPMDISVEDTVYSEYSYEEVLEFFNEYEFHSLIKRLNLANPEKKEELQTQPISFTEVDENSIASYLLPNSHFVVEVFGGNYHTGKILGLAIANEKGNVYIPFESMIKSEALKSFLEDDGNKKLTFDYKKAYVVLKKVGITLGGVDFDLLTAAYILNPSYANADLRVLTSNFGYNDVKYDEEIYGKNTKYHEPSKESVMEHAIKKVIALKTLTPRVIEELKETEQFELYEQIEHPLTPILAEMELAGVAFSIETLDDISSTFESRIQTLESDIHQLAGKPFNISSPKQLGVILFEDLGLRGSKKTKTGYSTSADVLEKLVGEHPIIEKIMEYRTLTKLYSTYILGLKSYVHEDGRIHTIFNQTLTQTGRLSSNEPNIQNIPIRYEEGRLIRKAFIPRKEGNLILAADYSQIELRVLAHLAEAENLKDAFVRDFDIHTKTAMDVFDVREEEVTSLMRRQAKAVNFGIIYGISAFGLSENLNISPKEAQQFIDKYLETYPGIQQYMTSIIEEAKESGFAKTIFNRRRYIEELKNKNYNVRMFGERTAMNAPIQGSAADIIKVAMIKVYNRMKKENLKSQMIIQVHDELIFDVVEEEFEHMKQLVQEEMEHAVELRVPLKVGMGYGESWYDAK